MSCETCKEHKEIGLPIMERYASVEYATAIGLALKGLDYENIN
jgi:hypothetical protein